jgi:tetratricopeptide (TPR) repeat protein
MHDAECWYIHGFIYKSIYNKSEKANRQSPTRLVALNSFRRSLSLDASEGNVQENVKNIKYLASTLYNDAAASLDSVDYKIAITNFGIYREYYPLVDASPENIKQKEIDFALAIASLYTKVFESDRKGKTEFLKLAKEAYNKVLEMDPDNIGANYNMGILYYNQAVNLINQSDYDLDIVALNDVQDNSINLFKESLPFMEKAYSLDPRRKETLLGLSGIYFSLNEFEKSNMFKQKLEEIEKQK